MKKIPYFILFFLIGSVIYGQEDLDFSDYPVLKIAHETSLFRDDVNWSEISKQYIRLANESDNPYEKLEYLLNAMGDKHGAFRDAKTFEMLAYFTDYENIKKKEDRQLNSQFVNEVINDVQARFRYEMLDAKMGYLKIVGIGPQYSMEEDAAFIQAGIKDLLQQGAEKWVLDLRYNGGGNMNPMLAGLAELVGEGNIGGSCDKTGESLQKFVMTDGVFYDTENKAVDIAGISSRLSKHKVAVLLSRYTISSGEIVAVAMKGRNNTRFFGEKTRGYTTVTGYDFINEDLLMLISKAYYQDRLGNIYMDGVGVDEEIEFIEYPQIDNDEILEAAVKWLNKS